MAIYCPQGSGTLRQQLLMMHCPVGSIWPFFSFFNCYQFFFLSHLTWLKCIQGGGACTNANDCTDRCTGEEAQWLCKTLSFLSLPFVSFCGIFVFCTLLLLAVFLSFRCVSLASKTLTRATQAKLTRSRITRMMTQFGVLTRISTLDFTTASRQVVIFTCLEDLHQSVDLWDM